MMERAKLLKLLALAYPDAEVDVLAFPTGSSIVEMRIEEEAVSIEDRVAEGCGVTLLAREGREEPEPTFRTEEELMTHLGVVMAGRRARR
ncbi:MAG: hypothetical protein HOW73_12340 [Polyangiaceae bacterium]|nr:hypothetical protein [Polyangiaceae bacterium]